MKSAVNRYVLFMLITLFASTGFAQRAAGDPVADEAVTAEFIGRVKAYVKMRETIEGEMPRLPVQATAAQIEKHRKELLRKVRAARAGVLRGNIFTAPASRLIQATIKNKFSDEDRRELRKLIQTADRSVPLRVNVAYPETKEQLEMPPELLLLLPELPKQIRYRFVGRNLLLIDRENNLIIDLTRISV